MNKNYCVDIIILNQLRCNYRFLAEPNMSKTTYRKPLEVNEHTCSVCGSLFTEPSYSHYECKNSLVEQLTEEI